MIEDWDEVKEQAMLAGVWAKFSQNQSFARQQLATGDATIIEGNYWGDLYWGADATTGEGLNRLGVILMQVRDALRNGNDLDKEICCVGGRCNAKDSERKISCVGQGK
jgi:predicted NAD-dependent protein-ADP-ribosyltransferase YbiA (DUF1768 family)